MCADGQKKSFGATRILREELAQMLARRKRRQRCEPGQFCFARLRVFPRAKAALERLVVMPAPETRRQLVEEAHVAAAKDDVFGSHRGAQQFGALQHDGTPSFFAE